MATDLVFQPQYDDALWKRAQIFIPYAQMHLAKGQHDLRIQLVASDARTGAALARPPTVPLTVTSQ